MKLSIKGESLSKKSQKLLFTRRFTPEIKSNLNTNKIYKLKKILFEKLGCERYNQWNKSTELVEFDDHQIIFCYPTLEEKNIFDKQLSEIFSDIVSKIFNRNLKIIFTVCKHLHSLNTYQYKEFTTKILKTTNEISNNSNLMHLEKDFSNFFVSCSNEEAFNAAKKFVELKNPGFNLLHIYGASDSGKTHLLKSIHKYINLNYPSYKDIFIEAESFYENYVNSLKDCSLDTFKTIYISCNILFIDNFEFFANRMSLHSIIVDIFSKLISLDRKIAVASTIPIREIYGFKKNLVNLFNFSLSLRINQLSKKGKLFLLRQFCKKNNLNISQYVLESIAEHNNTISEMYQKCLYVHSNGFNSNKQDYKINTFYLKGRMNLEEITRLISSKLGLKTTDVIGHKRIHKATLARAMCYYLARKYSDHSLNEIGQFYGGRTHSTVSLNLKNYSHKITQNKSLKQVINEIENRYNG